MAVGRLPTKASESMQQNTRQRVLDQYLGIESAQVQGRFKDPGSARRRG